MNVYAELWALLRPQSAPNEGALLGTVTAYRPLAVTVGDTVLTQNLFYPAGTEWRKEDVGKQAALLPCGEDGFLMLLVEGGST